MAEMINNRQPNLRPFIRQSKSVVFCAIKLVSQEESAKPKSLAKDFEIILEEDDVTKRFSLYKDRNADSIIDCIRQFQKLLPETKYKNNLVQACRLY